MAREGEAPAEPSAANHHDQITSPLNRACSVPTDSLANSFQPLSVVPDTSVCDDSTCDEVETRRREFLNALANDTAPVQPPVTDANGMQIEEPVVAEPVAATGRLLNRQERRARQKLLERKLRKAK